MSDEVMLVKTKKWLRENGQCPCGAPRQKNRAKCSRCRTRKKYGYKPKVKSKACPACRYSLPKLKAQLWLALKVIGQIKCSDMTNDQSVESPVKGDEEKA